MNSTFKLGYGDTQHKLALKPPDKPKQRLDEKHRPRCLADVLGQGEIVWRLEAFLEAPYSTAMLFEGPTGVGKTSAALALAAELGSADDLLGGLRWIKSGTQKAEEVESVLDGCRFVPMVGSPWKVVIIDEADWMSAKTSQLWLSALEDLPPKTVVIFTTNNPGKFPDRFLDRCERFTFASDAATHLQDAQALAGDVWTKEGMDLPCPDVNAMAGLVDASGAISYRRVVRALEPLIASARMKPTPEPEPWREPEPVLREPDPVKPASIEAELDAMVVAQVDAMLEGRFFPIACPARSTSHPDFPIHKRPHLSEPAPAPADPADNVEWYYRAVARGITLEPPPERKPSRLKYRDNARARA